MGIICSMDALKVRNNRISNQNLNYGNRSKSCIILREKYFGTFDESCAWLKKDKKLRKHCGYSPDYPNNVTSCRRTWENESAMPFVWSAVTDRSHS